MRVREIFPRVRGNEPLARKLGRANAQRRKWLEFRRQAYHSFEMPSHDADLHAQPTGASYKENSTSSDTRMMPPTSDNSPVDTKYSDATGIIIPYAAGSPSMQVEEDDQEALVPETPSGFALGNPFLCPYCYSHVEIPTITEWQTHVFADLSSYTCTFDSCPAPLFETRQQWFQHEMEVHRKVWRCDMCEEVCHSSWNMKKHLTQKHSNTINANTVEAHSERLGSPPEGISVDDCPLCNYQWTLQRQSESLTGALGLTAHTFGDHFAKHLEDLSLLVLSPQAAKEHEKKVTSLLDPPGTDESWIVAKMGNKLEPWRFQCPHCSHPPYGFRSVKNLGNHMKTMHRSNILWLCNEPDHDRISDTVRLTKQLEDCRQCSNKTRYATYHDAAAHLRGTHFEKQSPMDHIIAQLIDFEYVEDDAYSDTAGTMTRYWDKVSWKWAGVHVVICTELQLLFITETRYFDHYTDTGKHAAIVQLRVLYTLSPDSLDQLAVYIAWFLGT